ncbi:MAG: hypothetical protein K6F99_04105 [Lachnospiraceae bacterium]|nr:hypothetical protein [Lachnospiraceae bacterium]
MKNIDERTAADIENQIEYLRKQYTPEWHFTTENPDIGSTIARIFARQMQENIGVLNNIMDRYHAEFVNMLDLSLRPATPAGSLVVFNLVENSVEGTKIPKGTKLMTNSDLVDGSNIIFETDRSLYVTSSHITDVFMTDGEMGTIVPLKGRFEKPVVVEGEFKKKSDEESEEEAMEEDITVSPEEEPYNLLQPFILFGETNHIGRSVLVLYHESLFDSTDDPVFIRLEGNEELAHRIEKGEFVFKYYSNEGMTEFDSVQLIDDKETFALKKSKELRKVGPSEDKQYGIVIIEAKNILTEAIRLNGIGISSSGDLEEPDLITDGSNEYSNKGFDIFTDTLSNYNECYICHNRYFSKAGAKVKITFHTVYREHDLLLSPKEEMNELKIIKRKPKAVWAERMTDVFADEIAVEYFNGIGWKKLPLDFEVTDMFARENPGDYTISFTAPDDWAESEEGAYSGRSVRIQLIKANNCYMRPTLHHYPRVSNVKISFSYEGKYIDPQKVEMIHGTKKDDITLLLKGEDGFTALTGTDYTEDSLYIGLDKKMEDGPVSLFFQLKDINNQSELKCRFEYSTINGFKPMRVLDFTDDFSKSGIVVFMPPSDMHDLYLEGRKKYWIRIVRKNRTGEDDSKLFLPKIDNIYMNATTVTNTSTGDEEDFFIDESVPDMKFTLNANNILDTEVWVNEKGYISKSEMNNLMETDNSNVRVEYDYIGNVSAFYVKWNEVASFTEAEDRRSYILDRLTNEIIFSDGLICDIPKVTDDIAFKIRVRSSDGFQGNVPAGSIDDFKGQVLFIDSIFNPMKAYGGSSLETIPQALRRGANIMHSRRRLVSMDDYLRTIEAFSDGIDKVAGIVGETIDGKVSQADISFVLLMKDYEDGAFSFHRIHKQLKQYLEKQCELTISADRIHIVEPLFVDFSINVWTEISDIDDSFEIQADIKESLENYLNPVSTDANDGWEIGTLPKKSQILMCLSALKKRAIVKRISIITHYFDKDGEHEVDLDDLVKSPFMVCRSGEHHVYVGLGGE